jgi:hypothetical protein
MKKHKSGKKQVLYLGIGIVGVFVLVSSAKLSSISPKPQQTITPLIKNTTTALQLVNQEIKGASLILKLKNSSSKNITAYTISVSPFVKRYIDYSISGDPIEPDEIEEFSTSLTAFSIGDQPNQVPVVRILSVVFDDQSSDGDSITISEIKDTRLGKQYQIKQIKQLIEQTLNNSDNELDSSFRNLKQKITSLPETDRLKSEAFQRGLHNAKEDVLTLLTQSEKSSNEQIRMTKEAATSIRNNLHRVLIQTESWANRY